MTLKQLFYEVIKDKDGEISVARLICFVSMPIMLGVVSFCAIYMTIKQTPMDSNLSALLIASLTILGGMTGATGFEKKS
jgi:hypothetical protein